jgi:hypothetical protein
MKHLLNSLLLVLLLASLGEAHPIFTREPAGSTPLTDCPMDITVCNAVRNTVVFDRWYDLYNNATIISDGSEPASPPTVLDSYMDNARPCLSNPPGAVFMNCAVGGGQTGYISGAARRELFVGLMFKINSNYSCSYVGASKVFFVRTIDNPLGSVRTNGVFLIQGCGSVKNIIWSHNTGGGLDNSHQCPSDLGLACYANVGSGAIVAGQWTKIEVCIRDSSCPTCRDGVVKWWINGQPSGSYTQFNYGSGNVNEFVQNQTWDGYGNGQGFSTPSHQMFGHVYISAPGNGGCLTGTGSGGTTPPPPIGPVDDPAGNPSAPVGLIVTDMIEFPKFEDFEELK